MDYYLVFQGFIQVLTHFSVAITAKCLGPLSGKDQIPVSGVNHSQRLQITDPPMFLDFFFSSICQVRAMPEEEQFNRWLALL